MNVPLLRGVLTAILFGAFIALWIWAWSKQRKDEFDAAAQLALDDEQPDIRLGGQPTDRLTGQPAREKTRSSTSSAPAGEPGQSTGWPVGRSANRRSAQ